MQESAESFQLVMAIMCALAASLILEVTVILQYTSINFKFEVQENLRIHLTHNSIQKIEFKLTLNSTGVGSGEPQVIVAVFAI